MLLPFEVLYGSFMLFRGCARFKGPEVFALAGLGIFFL